MSTISFFLVICFLFLSFDDFREVLITERHGYIYTRICRYGHDIFLLYDMNIYDIYIQYIWRSKWRSSMRGTPDPLYLTYFSLWIIHSLRHVASINHSAHWCGVQRWCYAMPCRHALSVFSCVVMVFLRDNLKHPKMDSQTAKAFVWIFIFNHLYLWQVMNWVWCDSQKLPCHCFTTIKYIRVDPNWLDAYVWWIYT